MINALNISFGALWAIVFCFLLFRFVIFAFGSYYLFYNRKSKRWIHKKIQKKFPSEQMIKYEIRTSLLNLITLGVLSVVILWEIKHNSGLIYKDFHLYGWGYFFVSLLSLVLIHDTWFYWMHRLMHLPGVYRWTHRIHHKSTNPTPFSSFSMDWTELLIEFGIFPLLPFLIPLHPLAISIFAFMAFAFNILGHLGFELFPSWLIRSRVGQLINTSTKHNIHHERFNYNYGYYFTLWDRIMKTAYKNENYEK